MYSMSDIKRLQLDDDFYQSENDKYCLVSFSYITEQVLTKVDLKNQANFCVLQTIRAYKEEKIDKNRANFILNKIDALEYSEDMLGVEATINKLNKEIIGEELHIPFFNSLCVECGDLFDSFK